MNSVAKFFSAKLGASLDRLIEPLGWTLVHALWQLLVIGLLYAVVDRVLAKRSTRTDVRYCIGITALLMMTAIVPATFLLILSEKTAIAVVNKSPPFQRPPSQTAAAELDQALYFGDRSTAGIPMVPSIPPALKSMTGPERSLAREQWDQSAGPTRAGIAAEAVSEKLTLSKWRDAIATLIRPWVRVAAFVWCCGAVLFLIRPALGLWAVQLLKRSAETTTVASLQVASDQLASVLRIGRRVTVATSNLVAVPTLVGWIQPVILLPLGAVTGLSQQQLKAVLAHELAHVARHDIFVNGFQLLVEAVLFFHPAVWWLSGRIRDLREHCCDDMAVRVTGSRRDYVETLITLETLTGRTHSAAMAMHGGSLTDRIRRISGVAHSERKSRMHSNSWMVLALLVTVTTASAMTFATIQNSALPEDAVSRAEQENEHNANDSKAANNEAGENATETKVAATPNTRTISGRLIDGAGRPFVHQPISLSMNWRLRLPEKAVELTAKTPRRMNVQPQSAQPILFEAFESQNAVPAERVSIITGGVRIIISDKDINDKDINVEDNVPADGKVSSSVEFSADRVVIWQTLPHTPVSPDASATIEEPFEIYLEGNVSIRRANAVLNAARVMFSPQRKRTLLRDDEFENSEKLDAVPANNSEFHQCAERMRKSAVQQDDDSWGLCIAGGVTDADGRFAIKVSVPDYATALTGMNIESPAFMDVRLAYHRNEDISTLPVEITKEIGEVISRRLIPVTSTIFDPSGRHVTDATVRLSAYSISSDGHGIEDWWDDVTPDAADGTFTAFVPESLDVGIIIKSETGAILRRVMPAGMARWPDFYLERGTELTGRMLSRNGQPLVGVIVHIESDDRQEVGTELEVGEHGLGSLDIERVCITDDKGNFRFSQMLGHFVITLVAPSECYAPDSDEFRRCIAPVPFVPLPVELDGRPLQRITLVEAPTTKIAGTIRDEAGNGVAGIDVSANQSPIRGNTYINLAETSTGTEGRYELTVPVPLEKLSLHVRENENREAWVMTPPVGAEAFQGTLSMANFDGFVSDLDWKLFPSKLKRSDIFPGQSDSAETTATDPLIMQLEAMIQSEHDENLPTPAAKFFAFEEQHRGSAAAVAAISRVMQGATWSMDPALSDGRVRMIRVLREHYLNHFDLDLLIDGFTNGALPENGEELLRLAMDKSPHPHVRATATFELANVLLDINHMATFIARAIKSSEEMISIQVPATQQSMREDIARWKAALIIINQRSSEDRQREAIALLDQVISQYSDLKIPRRFFGGEHDVRLQVENPDGWGRHWSLAERASFRRFQILRLNIGSPAPEVESTNLFHERIRLSDYIGKVVVLTVNTGTVSEKPMYERCSKLLEQFRAKPVVVLSVISSDASGGYGVRGIVRECGITWPIIRDQYGGTIAGQWCVETSPEAWIIAPDGTLSFHESGYDSVSASAIAEVERLLNEAQQ